MHFQFDAVVFEPKPVQQPVPVHVGGDSNAALRRTVAVWQGWIGMVHDPSSFATAVDTLRSLAEQEGRDLDEIQCSALVADPDADARQAWSDAGATRLIVASWARSAEAIDGLVRFAHDVRITASTPQ